MGFTEKKGVFQSDSALVVSAYASEAEKAAARVARETLGELVQICGGEDDQNDFEAAKDALQTLGALYEPGRGKIKTLGKKFNFSRRFSMGPKVELEGQGIQASQICGPGFTLWESFDILGGWSALQGDETLTIDPAVKMEGTGSLKIVGGTNDNPGCKRTGLSLDWSEKEGIEVVVRPNTITYGSVNHLRLTVKDGSGSSKWYDEVMYIHDRWIRVFFDLLTPTGSSGTLDWTNITEVQIEARTSVNGYTFWLDEMGFNIILVQIKYANVEGEFGGAVSNLMLNGLLGSERSGIGIDVQGVQMVDIDNVMGFYSHTADVRCGRGTYFCNITHNDHYGYPYGSAVLGTPQTIGNPVILIGEGTQFHGTGPTFGFINPFWINNFYAEMAAGPAIYVVSWQDLWISSAIFIGNGNDFMVAVYGGNLHTDTAEFTTAGTDIIKILSSGHESTFDNTLFRGWATTAGGSAIDLGEALRCIIGSTCKFINDNLSTSPVITRSTIYSRHKISGYFYSSSPRNGTIYGGAAGYTDIMEGAIVTNLNMPTYIGYMKDCHMNGGDAAVAAGGACCVRAKGNEFFNFSEGICVYGPVVEDNEFGSITPYESVYLLADGIQASGNRFGSCAKAFKQNADKSGAMLKANKYTDCTVVYDLAGTGNVFDMEFVSAKLDLSGAATDVEVYHAPKACLLCGYEIVYTEVSSPDAGVAIRVGRYQNGVALDDDYFDLVTSEASKNKGYSKYIGWGDLTNKAVAAGDTVTVGTAGGKVGTGEVILVIQISDT